MRLLARAIVPVITIVYLAIPSFAGPDWSEGAFIPVNGRANPYNLSEADFEASVIRGRKHALNYPVEISGVMLPYEATKNFMDGKDINPIRNGLSRLVQKLFKVTSFDELAKWLGLIPYPKVDDTRWAYYMPKTQANPEYRMGISIHDIQGAKSFTYSCATCHVGNLFGKPVFGLSNRFPRANQIFILGKKAFSIVNGNSFKLVTGASDEEVKVFNKSRQRMKSIESKKPVTLGLDTSLAHVALSLSHRNKDEDATFSEHYQTQPRADVLRHLNSDSKPSVWWTLKYKNRWLSDGSVVSGNPIYTNIMWNEIGRGTDLLELGDWLNENKSTVIKDFTTAVFSSAPPAYTDFFGEQSIDIEMAKRGQQVYKNSCTSCHGTYFKVWDEPGADKLPVLEQLKTKSVFYQFQTEVKDVGTDPLRFQGMQSLVQLNDLKISKENNIKIKMQKGYVAPPLDGIWARWPYFHNNSIPNLCVLLTPEKHRPLEYWSGPAIDPNTDFDQGCVGYPLGKKTPRAWKANKEHRYNAKTPGLSPYGHSERILTLDGKELLTIDEKLWLIEFLKTL